MVKKPKTIAVTKTVAEWEEYLHLWPGQRNHHEEETIGAQERIYAVLMKTKVTLVIKRTDHELNEGLKRFVINYNAGWKLDGRTKP